MPSILACGGASFRVFVVGGDAGGVGDGDLGLSKPKLLWGVMWSLLAAEVALATGVGFGLRRTRVGVFLTGALGIGSGLGIFLRVGDLGIGSGLGVRLAGLVSTTSEGCCRGVSGSEESGRVCWESAMSGGGVRERGVRSGAEVAE